MGARIHKVWPGGYIDLPRSEWDAPAHATALLASAGIDATSVLAIKVRPMRRIDAKTIGDRYAYEDEYDRFDRLLTKAGFKRTRARGVVGKLTRAGIDARDDGTGINARVWSGPITCVTARHESGLELFIPWIVHHAANVALAAETLNSIVKVCGPFIEIVQQAARRRTGERHFTPAAFSIETRSGVKARMEFEIPADADLATVLADLERSLHPILNRRLRQS